jgi:hypothetical protein
MMDLGSGWSTLFGLSIVATTIGCLTDENRFPEANTFLAGKMWHTTSPIVTSFAKQETGEFWALSVGSAGILPAFNAGWKPALLAQASSLRVGGCLGCPLLGKTV